MYQVMLVDDDYPVIDFLKQEIPWEDLGLTVTGAFTDGQTALEAARKKMPDILLTDIGMPKMDGMELIRELLVLQPELHCVILSCHDEFNYAQQAVKLGVHDYVLKVSMTEEAVIETLQKVTEKLDKQRKKIGEFTSLKKIVTQDYRKDQFMQYTGLDFNQHTYSPVLISVDFHRAAFLRFQTEDLLLYAIQNVAEKVSATHSPGTVCFRHLPLGVVMLLPHASTVNMLLQRIQRNIHQHLNIKVSCFMENRFYADAEQLNQRLRSLFKVAEELRFYTEASSILDVGDRPVFFSDESLFACYAEMFDELYGAILSEDVAVLQEKLHSIVETIRNKRYNPDVVKEWFLKLLLDMRHEEIELAGDPSLTTRESRDVLHTAVDQIHSLDELYSFALDFMNRKIKGIAKMREQSNNQEVPKAKQYVLMNMDKKVSLEDVARLLHHNTSYFSRLFKRETGMNFSRYVIHVKMERAKMHLKTTNKTVDEIALSLGYDNKGYFLRLFKQHTGMTPIQYAGGKEAASKK